MDIVPYTIPRCSHLSVIVNKAALSMMRDSRCEYSDNILRVSPSAPQSVGMLLHISKQILAGSDDYMRFANYYVHVGNKMQYVFLLVACGHCELCIHSKQLSIINRANLESSLYDAPAYMITLTYAPEFLPKNRIKYLRTLNCNTLLYSDVQKFFKRLRIRWTRAGLNHNISYMVAGEYGKKKNRPHYHIIMWNNPYHCSLHHNPWQPATNIVNHHKFFNDVFECWGMCSKYSFQCEPVDGGAPAYCAKYLTKHYTQKKIKDGRAPCFIHTSHAAGGLGSAAIDRYKSYYSRNSALQNFTYRDNTGVHQLPMCSFISKRLFPSASQQISSRYKLLFKSLHDVLHHGYEYGLFSSAYVAQMLNQYSLGFLYYKLDLPKVQHFPDVDFLDVGSRVHDCLNELLSDLDDEYLEQSINLDSYYHHKLAIVRTNLDNKNLAFDYLRVRNKQYAQFDRMVL